MTDVRPDPLTESPCGCAEDTRLSLSRRGLLAGAAGLVAAGVATSVPTQYAWADPGYRGDVLVVLSLRGGFDGLSAVAPVADAAYVKARPTIGLQQSQALMLDRTFGLHPSLKALKPFWDAKSLAFVHAVGQTSPTRSHFKAMEDMENAAPGSTLRTGWLDRMLGATASPSTFTGVAFGPSPRALQGPFNELSIRGVDQLSLSGAGSASDSARWRTVLAAVNSNAPAHVRVPTTAALAAFGTATKMKEAGYTPRAGVTYPGDELGGALRDVARLVKQGVGLRAAAVDFGGWDTHAGMGNAAKGFMRDHLGRLAAALAAFWTDLGAEQSRVTVITLSEFGRRLTENASGGLDHGHGNLAMVLGGGVNGGKVYGSWPGLASSALVDGDLAGTTDYRTILAEVMERRQKLTASTVFPGVGSSRLGLVRAA
ncbi:DUF1501 domain-containing protein [Auraticoccus monumenti]|uniref:Uncharacterized conserved protein, DUF1501 family n=1 Tax=Auraticoccus monumenti TaxID=675864 RepID=A0A1G7EAH9_9ACTN|nr:DUF1501 domain-containing protein [Auraticoccus monumenti]SDE60649.1 Uncharacterized conserved protein, DUF1501 family [Auraticoccus monumenti]